MKITSPNQRIPFICMRTGKTIQIHPIHLWKIAEKLPYEFNRIILTDQMAYHFQPIDNLVNCG